MEVESVDDLREALAEMGYSDNAIDEILKWFKNDTSDRSELIRSKA